jgi:hypothetical protein
LLFESIYEWIDDGISCHFFVFFLFSGCRKSREKKRSGETMRNVTNKIKTQHHQPLDGWRGYNIRPTTLEAQQKKRDGTKRKETRDG